MVGWSLFLLHVTLQIVFLGRALLRPHREPASRLAWVVVIIVAPVVGMMAYVLFGEVNIGRGRIARLQDSSLLARRICDMRVLLVGAPHYFEAFGKPQHPRDLAQHRCFTYANVETPDLWRFTNAAGEEQSVTVTGPTKW